MDEELELALLGTPQVLLNGRLVTEFKTNKAQGLLYYLAVTRESHLRAKLATLLWGDFPEDKARVNLSKALSELRSLVRDHILVKGQTISFAQDTSYGMDVERLETGIAGWTNSRDLDDLQNAVALYRDDFLNGFFVRNASAFETWMSSERERLRSLAVQGLQILSSSLVEQQEWQRAIGSVQRLLSIEPWRESAHRELMRLYAQTDQKAAALRQYQVCVAVLAEELGVAPSEETAELYNAIRSRNMTYAVKRQEPEKAAGAHRIGLSNLPDQPTAFVGREEELTSILDRLTQEECRLMTLVGFGGTGKTRLSIEVARRLLEDPPANLDLDDGVFFVPLQPVSARSGIIATIAEAIGFRFHGDSPPHAQLINYLREKRMLLVLDNFEQLLDHTDLLSDILAASRGVKLLVTSREALRLREEWFHHVAGMDTTDNHPRGQKAVQENDAVRLFVQSALHAHQRFSLQAEIEHVMRICRLVDGIPLAIELAAAWVKLLSCQQIVSEVEHDLDILTSRYQDLPKRHRSIRVLMEQSWQRLSDEEQNVLMRLSVFQGGCTLDAAEKITEASLPILANLVEKSLLRTAVDERYDLHGLLRQFAAKKLELHPETEYLTHNSHANYYLRFMQERTDRLQSNEQRSALIEIDREMDNVQSAWISAIDHRMTDRIDSAIDACYHYFDMRCRFQEGVDFFAVAVSEFGKSTSTGELAILSRLRSHQAALLYELGHFEDAEALLTASEPLLSSRRDHAFVLLWQGKLADRLRKEGDFAESQLQQSLELYRAIGDLACEIEAMRGIAQLYSEHDMPNIAKGQIAEAVRLSRRLEQPTIISDSLIHYGWLANRDGDYETAQICWEESLAISREMDDKSGIADSLNWLGWNFYCAGGPYLTSAVELYEQAMSVFQQIGVLNGMVLGDLALALTELGESRRAMQYARDGLHIFEQKGDVHMIMFALTTVAAAANGLGNTSEARICLTESLALARKHHVLANSAPDILYFAKVLTTESETSVNSNIQQEKRSQALLLLLSVISHRKSWQVYRDRALECAARLRTALPDDVIFHIEGRAEATSLEELAVDLLKGASFLNIEA